MSRVSPGNPTWRLSSGGLWVLPEPSGLLMFSPSQPGVVVSHLWAVGGWQGTPKSLFFPVHAERDAEQLGLDHSGSHLRPTWSKPMGWPWPLVWLSIKITRVLLTILFLERGEMKEKKGEKYQINGLPLTCPPLGTWPATQACAPTGNQTENLSVCRPGLNPPSHAS